MTGCEASNLGYTDSSAPDKKQKEPLAKGGAWQCTGWILPHPKKAKIGDIFGLHRWSYDPSSGITVSPTLSKTQRFVDKNIDLAPIYKFLRHSLIFEDIYVRESLLETKQNETYVSNGFALSSFTFAVSDVVKGTSQWFVIIW